MEQNLVDLVIHEIQIDQPLQWFLIINIGFVCIQLKILKKINNWHLIIIVWLNQKNNICKVYDYVQKVNEEDIF